MTIAENIAVLLGNDGRNFSVKDGNNFWGLMASHGAKRAERLGGKIVRYTFPDGSAITETGAAWGIGYAGCFCWQEGGHGTKCPSQE